MVCVPFFVFLWTPGDHFCHAHFYHLISPYPCDSIAKPKTSCAALKSSSPIVPQSPNCEFHCFHQAYLLSAESAASHPVLSLTGLSFLTAHRIIRTVQSHPPTRTSSHLTLFLFVTKLAPHSPCWFTLLPRGHSAPSMWSCRATVSSFPGLWVYSSNKLL